MKIAFFWTWEFSKNILEDLIKKEDLDIKLVVSQPDKPVWRKKEIIATPVKELAIKNSINVLQPMKLRENNEFFDTLKDLELDFIIVVAYWKIVPKEVLNSAKYWCINIHWSILPKYRWASPIQESIKSWDEETGVTIMYMSEWMDEWDILKIEKVKIEKYDKTEDIFKKFEKIAPDVLVETLRWIIKKEIKAIKQDEGQATYCSKIEKKDWEINWKQETAKQIFCKFKAYKSWPWVFSYYKNKKISFEDIDYSDEKISSEAWKIIKNEKQIFVSTINWTIILKKVKLEWKKEMDINTFINWNKDFLEYNFLNNA